MPCFVQGAPSWRTRRPGFGFRGFCLELGVCRVKAVQGLGSGFGGVWG